jgi:ribosomal protein S18 acetylase RimI-like enzyme
LLVLTVNKTNKEEFPSQILKLGSQSNFTEVIWMEIRTLAAKDAELYRVIRLEGLKLNPEAFGSSYEEELDYTIEVYGNRLGAELNFTYGAFDGDSLVGVVTLVPEGKRKMKHRANIYAMYVTPAVRGRGVGKCLMEKAIAKARKLEGTQQIYLTVTASNEPAKRLYSSLGFNVYGLDQKAMRIGDQYYDEELMVLFL